MGNNSDLSRYCPIDAPSDLGNFRGSSCVNGYSACICAAKRRRQPSVLSAKPLATSAHNAYLCVLLTLGIVGGAVWTQYIQEVTWSWFDPKIVFTLATWMIYVIQISIRHMFGWRGRKAAYSSIIGFGGILSTYVGVNLFLPSMHAF